MLKAWQIFVDNKNYPELYTILDKDSRLAKNLYNAALFRIRQTFCGWDKDDNKRTDNEKEVFLEIENTQSAYPDLKIKRVLSYKALEKIMRVNKNADFFSDLPMQTAQAVVHLAVNDFHNWLKALRVYKKDASKFLEKPRMPHYSKADRKTSELTNQDVVLYEADNLRSDQRILKLPGLSREKNTILCGMTQGILKQVTVKLMYGKFMMSFVMEDCAPPFYPDLQNMAGVDFGTDNIAAIACTDGSSVVFKGGAVLSENQLFAKNRADAVAEITRGHSRMHASSKYLTGLSFRHYNYTRDMMHKISCRIVSWCIQHGVGVLVIGVNRLWKQNADMGKQSNQKFVSVPHAQLLRLIEYKAAAAGISVVEQEESYTSKADVTANDFIPVYGQTKEISTFSGKRISRGRYRTKSGLIINADCNGAANILRKAFPDAWTETSDFSFLARPYSMTYQRIVYNKAC